jgi:hypothetical protein
MTGNIYKVQRAFDVIRNRTGRVAPAPTVARSTSLVASDPAVAIEQKALAKCERDAHAAFDALVDADDASPGELDSLADAYVRAHAEVEEASADLVLAVEAKRGDMIEASREREAALVLDATELLDKLADVLDAIPEEARLRNALTSDEPSSLFRLASPVQPIASDAIKKMRAELAALRKPHALYLTRAAFDRYLEGDDVPDVDGRAIPEGMPNSRIRIAHTPLGRFGVRA